jgi:DNA-binding NtrC family response regulator
MSSPAKDHEPTIAVINSNEDTTEMLRTCLQQHGFSSVVIGHVTEIKRGQTDFLRFLEAHDPSLFVWDIGIPYDENWRFVQLMMNLEQMKGRRVVLTTTNKRALDSMVGSTETMEIIGKPYDLDQVIKAVKKASGISPEPEKRP